MTKKVHIKTYGCQMNVYDSVRMADVLAPVGYESTDDIAEADLVLLNTCHIREKAAEKVYSDLGRIRKIQNKRAQNGKDMKIGVAGCVAQAEGEEIMRRTPYVDMVIGSQSYHELPEMLASLDAPPTRDAALSLGTTPAPPSRGERRVDSREAGQPVGGKTNNKIIRLDFPEEQKFDLLPETPQPQGVSAFVSVQEGCDKFCTFCVVPYTRGAEYSRPVAKVEKEVREQVEAGAVEVTLLGQNVNAYHGEAPHIFSSPSGRSVAGGNEGGEWGLGKLLLHLSEIDGLERLRFTTSHPRDMDDELIAAFGASEKIMPYFHLPIQSGSDRILKAMNRQHTAAHYIGILEKLRAVRPDIAFSGDFIVGFPGETDEDFEATLRVVETVGYASAYSFKYSPRPGTPAAEKEAQVEEAVKIERLARLQDLLNKQQHDFNRWTVGRTYGVILDRVGKLDGQLVGRSPYMQAVHVNNAAHLMGKLVEVDVVEAGPNSVSGVLVQDTSLRRHATST